MKASEVYRHVAREYERGTMCRGTCNELKPLLGYWPQDYARLFSPSSVDENGAPCYEFGLHLRIAITSYDELHEWRILALCFMAAIAEWDEKHAKRSRK